MSIGRKKSILRKFDLGKASSPTGQIRSAKDVEPISGSTQSTKLANVQVRPPPLASLTLLGMMELPHSPPMPSPLRNATNIPPVSAHNAGRQSSANEKQSKLMIRAPPRPSTLPGGRRTIYPDANGIYHSPVAATHGQDNPGDDDSAKKSEALPSFELKTWLDEVDDSFSRYHTETDGPSAIVSSPTSFEFSGTESPRKSNPDSFPGPTYFFKFAKVSTQSAEYVLIPQGQGIPNDIDASEDVGVVKYGNWDIASPSTRMQSKTGIQKLHSFRI